jgi:anti-sigma factor RsiW
MKCSKAHKLISPYIDSELPERDMRSLEDHMKACKMCRAELWMDLKRPMAFTRG